MGLQLSKETEKDLLNNTFVSQYCHVVLSDYRRGFGLDIGFIDHLQAVTTDNYNTIAISTLYKITLSLFCLQCLY
jgi:hypothetical protein